MSADAILGTIEALGAMYEAMAESEEDERRRPGRRSRALMSNGPSIYGHVRTRLGIRSLARRLRDAGVAAEMRESCHYTGGRYLSVFVDAAEFRIERVAVDEYLIADFDTPDAATLRRAAARLSRAMADLEVRHRFEVDDGGDEAADYLHHDWPA